jgi:hypothetical protein
MISIAAIATDLELVGHNQQESEMKEILKKMQSLLTQIKHFL